ncbi:MAG: hypothetical protein WA347_02990 [Rhabdochlamydiaceae bacterium]|jgi:hypothetical protein
MASFPEPVSSAVVVYNPQAHPLPEARAHTHYEQDLFMNSSFKAQISDARLLHPISVRERILAGIFSSPEIGDSLPKPFEGTCEALLRKITHTVHRTVDNLDYNGLLPYLKMTDQLEKGITFSEIRIDSRNEEQGSTCVGMSHAILKNLEEKHGIEGALAVERKIDKNIFEHAAVIIQCSDGFVLLDARSNPEDRIFSIPFESTVQYKDFSIAASKRGSSIPLTVKYKKSDDHPEVIFEYCTNVANGDDLVMKHFMMQASLSFIPISLYNPDGSARKYIIVVPNQSKIVLKNNNASQEKRTQTITFKSILRGELFQKLEAFMQPNYCCSSPGFHMSIDTLHQQLIKFASQEERIKTLFQQSHIDDLT